MRGALRSFVTNDAGVSAIEFALCAPICIVFILGAIELGADMMIDSTVQAVTQAAARSGLTNSTPATQSRADRAKSIVTNGLSGWLKIPNTSVAITESSYSTYSAMSSSSGTTGLGGYGDVVTYRVTLTTPGLTGIPKFFGFGPFVFSRNFIVQNEK